MKTVLAFVGLVIGASGMLGSSRVSAQPVYRCGDSYSQVPCPGGKVLEDTDSRTAAQRSEAIRVQAEERRRAAALERERRAQEKAQRPALAAGIRGRPLAPPESAASAPKHKKKRVRKGDGKVGDTDGDIVAVEPKKPRSKGTDKALDASN